MQMNLPQFLKNYRNKTVNDLYNRAFTNLSHSLCENKALIFIGFLYFLTTIIIHCFFNKKIIENLAFYYSLVNNLYILFFSTFGCFFLLSKIKNFGLPVTLKQTVYAISFSKYFFNFIIIYILFPIFFFSYSSIKQIIPYFFSFNFKHDYLLAKIDYILHMNNHPWEILHPIIGHPLITIVIDRLYIYWGIIFFFTVMYMAFHKNFVLRKRFFITLCFSWIFIGNILAAFFFSAGPCYFKEVTVMHILSSFYT